MCLTRKTYSSYSPWTCSVFFPKFSWNMCSSCFNLLPQSKIIFIIKMRINHFSLYILYFSWFTCSSFAESVSKVRVCFPSGVYIGTDRQCDKWHWINPFLNAFRDVSVPLVTHTRDLCKSRSLLLWETHLQTLRQTLKWADNWTNTVGGCRGKGRRGTAVRQMWGLDCCQAAPRHPAADPSSQYERGRKKERERDVENSR